MDGNRKHGLMLAGGTGFVSVVLLSIVGMAIWRMEAPSLLGFLGLFVCLLTALALIAAAATFAAEAPTLALPKGFDRGSFPRMLDRLASISMNGLPPSERIAAQRDIDAGDEHLRHMLGKEAWVSVSGKNGEPVPETMRMRSEAITSRAMLAKWSSSKHGVFEAGFRNELAGILPTIVAIIRDFGLEPRGFAPSSRRLPGQDLGAPTAVPLLAAPARTLAAEWLNGDNGSVPMLDRIEADKAATTELDALESAWVQARSTTPPEEVDGVDASFQRGIGRLCATLSETIALRARTDRDVLETNVRYLDVKHPA